MLLLGVPACGMLDVTDPTRIEEKDIQNAVSANMLRVNAVWELFSQFSTVAHDVGLATDELIANTQPSTTMWYTDLMDRRLTSELDADINGSLGISIPWRAFATARWRAAVAIPVLRGYAAPAVRNAHIGEMFAIRGYATLQIAQDICPGFPLNEAVDGRVVPGPPLTTAQGFQAALAEFDSTVAYAGDSVRILNLGRLGRGRALLGLGRFEEAAAAVTEVPTSFEQLADQNSNRLFTAPTAVPGISAADRAGRNGLDFVSSGDPRVRLVPRGTAYVGEFAIYSFAKYPTSTTSVVFASGIEARLIEAEAALNAGDPAWLTILNGLRATQVAPGMEPLADPGEFEARVDLLFRERAFWLYLTGRRLGDLRRLVAHYDRDPETVFPTGEYYRGGFYGAGTSLPFLWTSEAPHNSAISGCTGT